MFFKCTKNTPVMFVGLVFMCTIKNNRFQHIINCCEINLNDIENNLLQKLKFKQNGIRYFIAHKLSNE